MCRKGVELAHYGECAEAGRDDECPKECSKDDDNREDFSYPVCGSDGNAYASYCDMKKRTCGQR